MDSGKFRITDNTLLVVNANNATYEGFLVDETGNQFLHTNDIDRTVWGFGSQQGKVNKVYNSPRLLDVDDLDTSSQRAALMKLLFKQGFDWSSLFGVIVIVRGSETGKVYFNSMVKTNDLEINFEDSVELIDGSFWSATFNFMVPNVSEQIIVYFDQIKFDDIEDSGPNIGKVLTYPTNTLHYVALVTEAPLPPFIVVNASIDANLWLVIDPATQEFNKTLEQSLLDYFGLRDNYADIRISHIVRYGNTQSTVGFKTIRLSNEDNMYDPISVGLDFTVFEGLPVTIYVSSEFSVNNKLMKRETQIVFDYADIVNPLLGNLILQGQDITMFPVNVVKQTVIEQQVIEAPVEQRIVTITHPVYVSIVSRDVNYDSRNIRFEEITVESYLSLANDTILSKSTAEGYIYFELWRYPKPEKNEPFKVKDATNGNVLLEGMLIVQ